MTKISSNSEKIKYDWFQISGILQLGTLDREVVKEKFFDDQHTEGEWIEILKKEGLNF